MALPVSDLLRAPVSTGVELCYQTFGPPDGEPLLLVMGLGCPMTWWDVDLCERLVRAGFHVIRYDNRDTGRSTKIHARVARHQLVRAFAGRRVAAPYSVGDMAADASALLDHLGVDAAHVAGVSMGGMIAQTLAIEHPGRVRSLTSIMSTTGRRTVGWQHPRMLPKLFARRPEDREGYVAGSVAMARAIGSPGFHVEEEALRVRGYETYDRGVSPSGTLRQMLAIATQPDRTSRLHGLAVPTLVMHGLADPMVHVSGGRSTANAVPGAELVLVDGMGHDLPSQLFDTFTDGIRRTADRRIA